MSKLIIALIAVNVAFAGSTLFLARELGDERDRDAVPSLVNRHQVTQESEPEESPVIRSDQVVPAPPVATSTDAKPTVEKPRVRQRSKGEIARAERLLASYADPEFRQQMLETEKLSTARSLEGLLAESLVTREELDHLVAMIAEWQLSRSVAAAQCTVDPACERDKAPMPNVEAIRGEIADYLGPERYARYREYREESGERASIDMLRTRLTGSSWMTDAQARTLVAALADERRKFEAEVKEQGGTVVRHPAYMVMRARRDAGQPRSTDFESIAAFNERMRARAEAILTPEQLKAFTDMQERSVAVIRMTAARREERAARAAGAKKGTEAAGNTGR